MTVPPDPAAPTRRVCTLRGCGRAHLACGFCRPHYARWRRHGTPQHEVPVAARPDGPPTYWAAHERVRAQRGPASALRCGQCGQPAAVWCYDGTDPAARMDARGRCYSLDPARYRACCRFCQRRAVVDRSTPFPPVWHRPGLDPARAEQLYRAGASSRGIAALMGVSRGVVLRALRARAVPIRPPVAPQRRPRRYPVTPRPETAATPVSDRHPSDPNPPTPIFNDPTAITSSTSTTTTTTSTTSHNPEQHPEQHPEPQSQSGPTHQRSLGRLRVPCGPAADDTDDHREVE